MAKESGTKLIVQNKKARHDYAIEDHYEAGLVLTGTEVKSLREGRASLAEAFISIDRRGELWLEGAHIPEYLNGTWNNHAPKRKRKLLLHEREIVKLSRQSEAKGYTIIPISLYFKNGRGNAERSARVVPAERSIVGRTNVPADLGAPGVVHSHGEGHINIWAGNGKDSPTVHEIAANFSQAGLPCEADPQVQVSIWEKVAFNAALNSVCAVTRRTVGAIGHAEEGRQVTSRIVSETVAVAQAAGVDADQRRVIAAVDYAFRHHQQHKPSMLQDVEAGRKTEIDFINGAVVERGKRLGVATPVLEMLFSLVKLSEG